MTMMTSTAREAAKETGPVESERMKGQRLPNCKPCPFCGGSAYNLFTYGDKTHFVCCQNSTCSVRPCTHAKETAEDAETAWNRRVVKY